jgi:serine/threonine protein kinase
MQNGVLKLGDFCVVRKVANERMNMTMIETPLYMSPEILKNNLSGLS